jgi:hypothetical protein
MEDDAYPEWLWGLLGEGNKSAAGGDAVDLSCTFPLLNPPPRRDDGLAAAGNSSRAFLQP